MVLHIIPLHSYVLEKVFDSLKAKLVLPFAVLRVARDSNGGPT